MRNAYRSILVRMTFCLPLAAIPAVALLIPPDAFFAQQGGTASSQMSSESLSPEAQAKLIKKIQSAILKLPYFGVFDNIAFQLQGRTVTLLGSVTSEHSQTKQDAERAVKKVEGVEKVINNIEVLPPAPLDDRLRRQVYTAIYNYGPLFKYSNDKVNPPIRIIVKGSRVTLEGIVDTETDKNLCTLRANQVPGVLSVTNNLRVVKG
jgi:hyperosmotically inducible protein